MNAEYPDEGTNTVKPSTVSTKQDDIMQTVADYYVRSLDGALFQNKLRHHPKVKKNKNFSFLDPFDPHHQYYLFLIEAKKNYLNALKASGGEGQGYEESYYYNHNNNNETVNYYNNNNNNNAYPQGTYYDSYNNNNNNSYEEYAVDDPTAVINHHHNNNDNTIEEEEEEYTFVNGELKLVSK
ncbi:Surp module, putative [Angomonas deanei]|uniref:Surp module, putative n=1 Tax=Angomonas deanei TaxID=59799 RepID=A0A7G2C9M1_9TRYP|nr:Surp module, putative [Angomonas deanei]